MRFAWDENKNKTNRARHGVSFETAQCVFDDRHAISVQDRHECGEERWQTLGLVGGVVVLLVAHTYREQGNFGVIHMISARKATKRERQRYEQAR